MDEEALLYEDDYEPELEPEPIDAFQHEPTPASADTEQEACTTTEAAENVSGKDGESGIAARGGEPAGPSGRGNGNASSKIKRGRVANQNQVVRYFIIRSSTLQNIFISVRVGAWATTRQNDDKLDEAFRKSKEVRLLYSVTGSNAFQGYAVMRTPIGKFGRPVVWENGKQFGNPFGVEWRVLFELPHSECDRIRNPFNDNKPVHIARDGTELPQEQGDLMVRLMHERASAAGAKPPRQQLAMIESGSRPVSGPGMPGRGVCMPNAAGRLGPGPRGPGMGPGMRPVGGIGMDPTAMMVMGGMGPGGIGPIGGMAAGLGGVNLGPNMEQILAAMTMSNMNPAALAALLQQPGVGVQPGGMQQQANLQPVAAAKVAQMANLPPEQQAIAMTAISAANPMLAEAIAAIIRNGGPVGVGTSGMQPGPVGQRPAAAAMAVGKDMAGMNGAMGGSASAMGGSGGQGAMGGMHHPVGVGGRGGQGDVGVIGGGVGPSGQHMMTSQQMMQAAQHQLMSINRDEVVLEGSDGRLRSGRSRSRSRSRSPVQGRRRADAVDFSNMTYEQYLQQYSRVQQEVQRRVGGSGGHQRGRSPERLPRHARDPTPPSQATGAQGRTAGGGDGFAAGGSGAGSGVAGKPGGQPYTEEE